MRLGSSNQQVKLRCASQVLLSRLKNALAAVRARRGDRKWKQLKSIQQSADHSMGAGA